MASSFPSYSLTTLGPKKPGQVTAWFSCRYCFFPGPAELGAVNPYAVHDDGEPTRQRHDRLLHSAAPGDLHGWIVNLAGGGATSPRPIFSAYGAAKTALVRFGETLAVECANNGIRVNSVAPGAFRSGMTEAVLSAGGKAGQAEASLASRLMEQGNDTAERAAALIAYLVAGEGRDITGKIISAVGDDWSHMHERNLKQSDLYTLRRMVPPH